MRKFEYKAVPAPTQGTKAKGVKTTEDRFALSFSNALNDMAADGWEYVRAETLPVTERKGLTGSQQTYQNMLIFRRLEAAPLPLTQTEPSTVSAISQDPAEAPQSPRITSRPPDNSAAPPVRVRFED